VLHEIEETYNKRSDAFITVALVADVSDMVGRINGTVAGKEKAKHSVGM